MNDIERQALILLTMIILSVWKLAELIIYAYRHVDNIYTYLIVSAIISIAFIKYNVYKRKIEVLNDRKEL